MLARYAGTYQFDDFELEVKFSDDGLLLGCARACDFSLLPRSETEFLVEDLDAAVTFELDEADQPVKMIGHFAPGKAFVGKPVTRR